MFYLLELIKKYHCYHVYCDWSGIDKDDLKKHERDEVYHEKHLQRSQIFCEACKKMVDDKVWPDIHGQLIVNEAKKRKPEMIALIKRLEKLQQTKIEFKKAEEEFIYRHDENYRPELVTQPGMFNPTFKNTPAKIELPNGVQEFELLPEQWEKQEYFQNIQSIAFNDDIPVVARRIIEKYKAKEYSVERLQRIFKDMTDRYKQIQTDEVYKQWLLFNICQLKLFMKKKGLKLKQKSNNTVIAPINSPVTIPTPGQQQIVPQNAMPMLNPFMMNDPKFAQYMLSAMMQYLAENMQGGMPGLQQMQQMQMQQMQQTNQMPMMPQYAPTPPIQNYNMMPNMNWQQWMPQPQQMQPMFGSSQSSMSTPPSRSSEKKDKKSKHKK